MKALDWLDGVGIGLPSVLHNDCGHVAANVVWRAGTDAAMEINIIGKASDPKGVESVPYQVQDGAKLSFTFKAGFVPAQYWRATMRAAYLAAFERLGYGYALTDSAEQIRRVLKGVDPIPEVILRAHPRPTFSKAAWVLPIRGESSFLAVMLRLRSETIRYLAVFLPGGGWPPIIEIAANWKQLQMRGTCEGSEILITFGPDPAKSMSAIGVTGESRGE